MRSWRTSVFIRSLALLVWALPSCSVNILETFGDPTTNEALLYDAKMLINEGDYATALTKFAEMSSDFLATRDVRVLHASAYAGVCGLNFLTMVDDLNNLAASGDKVFFWLMKSFTGGTDAKRDACISAEQELQAIAKYGASRTADENLLMAMIGLSKIGVILSKTADLDNNDVVDPAFDPCVVGAGGMTSTDAQHVATGLNIVVDALQNIGSSTVGSSALGDAGAACGALPPGVLCGTPAKVLLTDLSNPTDEKAARTLIYEGSYVGLDALACGGGDPSTCNCP